MGSLRRKIRSAYGNLKLRRRIRIFTLRHYVKPFEKKYKTNWLKTRDDIVEACKTYFFVRHAAIESVPI